jgi:hypothetical protein
LRDPAPTEKTIDAEGLEVLLLHISHKTRIIFATADDVICGCKPSTPKRGRDDTPTGPSAEKRPALETGHSRYLHTSDIPELTGSDLAEIVGLLECKLAWYGFRSVKVGPFIRVNDNTVSIDLLNHGDGLCRIELDRRSHQWHGLDGIQRANQSR